MALPKKLKESQTGIAETLRDTTRIEDQETVQKEALGAKANASMASNEIMTAANKRRDLLAMSGFDYVDVREVSFNAKNTYSIDKESIEALADLIYTSKNTTPVVLRRLKTGELQVLDGERRCRAHLMLGERYGEHYYMIPARIFNNKQLSDEDAEYILHAENIGQRRLTAVERAKGFKAVQERILEMRAAGNPDAPKGKMADILAKQFGCSVGTAHSMICIASAIEPVLAAFDAGELRQDDVVQLSRISEEAQLEILSAMREEVIKTSEVAECARDVRNGDPVEEAIKKAVDRGEAETAALEAALKAERANRRSAEEKLSKAQERCNALEDEATEARETAEAMAQSAHAEVKAATDRIAELETQLEDAKATGSSRVGRKPGTKGKVKESNDYMKAARRSLAKALTTTGDVDAELLDEITIMVQNLKARTS